jgi:hypothetical protein
MSAVPERRTGLTLPDPVGPTCPDPTTRPDVQGTLIMADFTVGKYLATRLALIGLKHYFIVPEPDLRKINVLRRFK